MMLLRLPSSHEIEDPIGRWHHSLVFDFFLLTFGSILRNSLNYFTETLEDLEICGEFSNRRLLDGIGSNILLQNWPKSGEAIAPYFLIVVKYSCGQIFFHLDFSHLY